MSPIVFANRLDSPDPPPPEDEIPDGAIEIDPGEDIQSFLTAGAVGATFYLHSGYHRIASALAPKSNQKIYGSATAIVSGAREVTNGGGLSWSNQGSNVWRIGSQTETQITDGVNHLSDRPRGSTTNDLFIDKQWQIHVASSGAVAPGMWFYDYAADFIYIYSTTDPTSKLVEVSVTPAAFQSSATGCEFYNFIVEGFASQFQHGAFEADGHGWIYDGLTVRNNHSAGIRITAEGIIRNCVINYNGQIGVGGGGGRVYPVSIFDTELGYNNQCHAQVGNEGGGFKLSGVNGGTVRGCWAHHNVGPGLWYDIDNINYMCEGNLAEDNIAPFPLESVPVPGIMVEISRGGVVRNNICRRNGLEFTSWIWSAGILMAAVGGNALGTTPDVEIYGNYCEDNAHGISLIQQNRPEENGPYHVQNCKVHDNFIRMNSGKTGGVRDNGETAIFNTHGNEWTNNTYYTDNPNSWAWDDSTELTFSQWQATGNDTGGSVHSYASWPYSGLGL